MSEYKPMGYLRFEEEFAKLFGVKDRTIKPPGREPHKEPNQEKPKNEGEAK
jgi:hypothetical protein